MNGEQEERLVVAFETIAAGFKRQQQLAEQLVPFVNLMGKLGTRLEQLDAKTDFSNKLLDRAMADAEDAIDELVK